MKRSVLRYRLVGQYGEQEQAATWKN